MERDQKIVRMNFNDEMARAIVEGRQTATRRPCEAYDASLLFRVPHGIYVKTPDEAFLCKTICRPGDLLIGRECWRFSRGGIAYRASEPNPSLFKSQWCSSTQMADAAARIRRLVRSVTVERDGHGWVWRIEFSAENVAIE